MCLHSTVNELSNLPTILRSRVTKLPLGSWFTLRGVFDGRIDGRIPRRSTFIVDQACSALDQNLPDIRIGLRRERDVNDR